MHARSLPNKSQRRGRRQTLTLHCCCCLLCQSLISFAVRCQEIMFEWERLCCAVRHASPCRAAAARAKTWCADPRVLYSCVHVLEYNSSDDNNGMTSLDEDEPSARFEMFGINFWTACRATKICNWLDVRVGPVAYLARFQELRVFC
jgi:hypothetical protein